MITTDSKKPWNFWRELEMLVIPLACPGCGLPDVKLCADCGNWLNGPLVRVERQIPRLDDLSGTPPMPVWALGEYSGPARGMVVAWKDRGREDLTRIYRAATLSALRKYPQFPAVDVVVPMPSSSASIRHRGRDHLEPVCQGVANELRASSARALTKRSNRDQVGLSARARGQADIRYRKRTKLLPRTRVLLFDDVVTTGATLAAASSALTAQGCVIVGAIVLAATPPQAKPEIEVAAK